MSDDRKHVSGVEVFFEPDDIIVSKTNKQGHITYANDVFLDIAGYTEEEVVGKPHSVIRHPDMPRCIFKALWESIQSGEEIFAYVMNRAKNGDHYWVLAHVTPSLSTSGEIIGYHSNRRVPNRASLEGTIIPLYQDLLRIEAAGGRKQGLEDSSAHLAKLLSDKNMTLNEFSLSLA